MNYEESVKFVESFVNYERTTDWSYPEGVKLDRMKKLCKELGNPQNAFESVLIAGSKGKGSTAAILSSILRMEGLKVGLYTSPHLLDIRERIQVNGLQISETRWIELVLKIRNVLDDTMWRRDPPTYFEVLTALAFCYFKEMKVSAAVLEVGLGGLYDSTNVAPAKVAGITPISLEHMDKLGKTVAKIAVQKCGIIKGRQIVVAGPQSTEADVVIHKAAEERDAELWRVGREIKIFERGHDAVGQRFDVRAPFANYFDLRVGLLGYHQLENSALAIGLAKAFEKKARIPVSESAVRQGILDAHWPGRFEKVSEHPAVILDGAQNAESLRRLFDAVKRHYPDTPVMLLFGVSADKDIEGMLDVILSERPRLFLTMASSPRALTLGALKEAVRSKELSFEAYDDPWQGLLAALKASGPNDLVLAAGSLFLVADLKKRIGEHGL